MAFDPTLVGPHFRYQDAVVLPNGATPTRLCLYNPYRVAILFSGQGATPIVRPILPATAQLGFPVANIGVSGFLTLTSHGALVQQEFWCATGAGSIYVMEVLWQP